MECSNSSRSLNLLPYHGAIVSFLKREEPELWQWFRDERAGPHDQDALRLELLKTAYRIQRETEPALYEAVDLAASRLAIDVPVTVYQAHNAQGLNASLAFAPDEAHIVLSGPVVETLDPRELCAVVGHELAHVRLWKDEDGEVFTADQILAAMTQDSKSEVVHMTTATRFALYSEIYCDRGALLACEELHATVSLLVKVETGLKQVSAADYLRQADEIYAAGEVKTEGVTHPETFLRAKALREWSKEGDRANARVEKLVCGRLELDELDLLLQGRVADVTKRIIDALIAPEWFRSALVLSHARMFFNDYTPPANGFDMSSELTELKAVLNSAGAAFTDYGCYVMLDFVTVDRSLEPVPLAAAIQLARNLGWHDRFAEIAKKELRLRKRQFESIAEQAEEILEREGQRGRGT
jgi:Zn-dependent protease with chaperone function